MYLFAALKLSLCCLLPLLVLLIRWQNHCKIVTKLQQYSQHLLTVRKRIEIERGRSREWAKMLICYSHVFRLMTLYWTICFYFTLILIAIVKFIWSKSEFRSSIWRLHLSTIMCTAICIPPFTRLISSIEFVEMNFFFYNIMLCHNNS